VKIKVRDIEAAAKELHYQEPSEEIGQLLDSPAHDYRLPRSLTVRLSYYRAGSDLFFRGRVEADVIGSCSRCLEEYAFPLALDFAFVLVPRHGGAEEGLEEDDRDLSYYEGEEVDLSPLLREQVLLALPTRPLCRENCAGLCPQCGANRNTTRCKCEVEGQRSSATGLPVFKTLKLHS
jgi:DUF177 domain-containing protein